MEVFAFILLAIILVFVLPLSIVMHYVTRWREQRSLSHEEENEISALWETCEAFEKRINNIERVMDIEVSNPHTSNKGQSS